MGLWPLPWALFGPRGRTGRGRPRRNYALTVTAGELTREEQGARGGEEIELEV
jgi:hypothetical protein